MLVDLGSSVGDRDMMPRCKLKDEIGIIEVGVFGYGRFRQLMI